MLRFNTIMSLLNLCYVLILYVFVQFMLCFNTMSLFNLCYVLNTIMSLFNLCYVLILYVFVQFMLCFWYYIAIYWYFTWSLYCGLTQHFGLLLQVISPATVFEIKNVSDSVKLLSLQVSNRDFSFKAGQWCVLLQLVQAFFLLFLGGGGGSRKVASCLRTFSALKLTTLLKLS